MLSWDQESATGGCGRERRQTHGKDVVNDTLDRNGGETHGKVAVPEELVGAEAV